jgi:hypothetical protein
MANAEILKKYLVGGDNGYLLDSNNNGKVIMLSGKWGSGKTHFWKNIIEEELIQNQTKKQKAYVYSSLYGNRTLDKIEDNIYAQAYLCSVGGKNAVLSGYEKVKDFGKRFGSFCSLLDVSKLVDGIDDIQQKNIKRSALSYLENGGIVCFDDFERKSKDIDLNDLFGFISHLAIDLNCKVVIILNDDVFEGVEKDVFSRVKEKSVSKFLKYEPSIRDLFKSIIFQKNSEKEFKYSKLRKHLKIILKTIEETEELNARIYIQVLDNLVEWIKTKKDSENYLKYFIYVNINFILNHHVFQASYENVSGISGYDMFIKMKGEQNQKKENKNIIIFFIKSNIRKPNELKLNDYDLNQFEQIKIDYELDVKLKKFIEENKFFIKSELLLNLVHKGKVIINNNQAECDIFNKINNFIETGILINE